MSWTGKEAPSAPTLLQVEQGKTSDRLVWYGARDRSGANYLTYNVYASSTYPVDTSDPGNLISIRQRQEQLSVPHKGNRLYYAVTATDRYGNESAAIQESQKTSVNSERKPLTPITQRRNPWRK